jgi:hypothetical protein
MHRREKERAKPGLARAHHPFTPITHKPVKPAETPFQPLRVNDLETPKSNKSDSIGALVPDAEIVAEAEFTTPDKDLKALRHALLSCIGILDRMDKRSGEQIQRRPGSAQTAADAARPGANAPKAPNEFDGTEVIVCDRLNQQGPSPVAKVPPATKPKDTRKPLQPVNRVPAEAKPPQRSAEESSTGEDDGNLQKRLHEMSLLLKRLENQIEGVNTPYEAVE